MSDSSRVFTSELAVRRPSYLLIGITGESGSGKTFSALELATGIQRVSGGEIFGVDSEHNRMTHYSDRFKFRHVPLDAPYGPLDYLAAHNYCIEQGASVIVYDSMTNEHSGPGGVMDQSEQYLDRKCGDDETCRRKNFMLSLVKPKLQRNKLNLALYPNPRAHVILCYHAKDRLKPVTGKEPEHLGWTADTTSTIIRSMTVRFLLEPGCDGIPTINPEERAAKLTVKNPIMFRDMLKDSPRLSADLGEKLARWASGTTSPAVDIVAAWPTMTDDAKRVAWRSATAEQKAAIQALKRPAEREPGVD